MAAIVPQAQSCSTARPEQPSRCIPPARASPRHPTGMPSLRWPDTCSLPMDDSRGWCQLNIAFPDWSLAEPIVLAHLAPQLAAAEDEGLIAAWFFIRKHPCWPVRYLPPPAADTQAPIG